MLLRMFQFSRPPAVDSLSVTEAYHQLAGPKGLPSGKRLIRQVERVAGQI
jgi:hypothetical protein